MTKTNAIRKLESEGVAHKAYEYEQSDGKIDGISVAEKIGQPLDRVFKTLVTVGKTTGHNVFVVPVESSLDLKKAAIATGDKYIEMIKIKDLEPLTGYIHGGCSPIGMKKPFPTFIEETAVLHETIFLSAGRVGLQVEISPEDLAEVVSGELFDLI